MYTTIKSSTSTSGSKNVQVFLIFESEKLHEDYLVLDKKFSGLLSGSLKRSECNGGVGECTVSYGADNVVCILLGLGKADKFDAGAVRSAGGALVRKLYEMGVKKIIVNGNAGVSAKLDDVVFGRALGEGLGIGAFNFDDFKQSTKKEVTTKDLMVASSNKVLVKGIAFGLRLAESTNYARRLAATPPNVATTTYVAAEAQKLAGKSNGAVKCSVIKGKALELNKLVGLINVGKASENPPCLIILDYNPGKKKSQDTVLLVGKTICYDTGGLSLKISNGMKGMKYDKNGGMAVLGTMHAVSWIKPKCRVVALLPAAENSISDEAYRPDDIITFLNGVTVEVTNTDAEGRLVLADGLAYGCKKYKPNAVIDIATLTGGVVVALGSLCAGLWCDDDGLRARLNKSSKATEEYLWRLPLFDDYKEMMKSQHADIWNSAPVRHAHPIQGAAFLSYFVDENIPWAHIDIAGTSKIDKPRGAFSDGPTGFGVRLLADMLENWHVDRK